MLILKSRGQWPRVGRSTNLIDSSSRSPLPRPLVAALQHDGCDQFGVGCDDADGGGESKFFRASSIA